MSDNTNDKRREDRDQLVAELKRASRESLNKVMELEFLAWAMLLEDMREIKNAIVGRKDATAQGAEALDGE